MIIKVCGLTDNESSRAVAQIEGVSHLGFIFHEASPRFTTSSFNTPKKKIGVFVDEEISTILELIEKHKLNGVQLHGNESPEIFSKLPQELLKIKAFGISSVNDLKKTSNYEGLIDYFLFDTKTEKFGGTGRKFDWSILNSYTGKTPFILSGGIGLESAHELDSFAHPKLVGYDLNSRFERAPKDKNATQIKQFTRAIL